MTLGERLAYFAEKRFGSQDKFAEAVGIIPGTISKYCLGKQKPGSDALAKFKAAGLSLDWLVYGIEPMDLPEPRREIGKVTRDDREALQEITRQLLEISQRLPAPESDPENGEKGGEKGSV